MYSCHSYYLLEKNLVLQHAETSQKWSSQLLKAGRSPECRWANLSVSVESIKLMLLPLSWGTTMSSLTEPCGMSQTPQYGAPWSSRPDMFDPLASYNPMWVFYTAVFFLPIGIFAMLKLQIGECVPQIWVLLRWRISARLSVTGLVFGALMFSAIAITIHTCWRSMADPLPDYPMPFDTKVILCKRVKCVSDCTQAIDGLNFNCLSLRSFTLIGTGQVGFIWTVHGTYGRVCNGAFDGASDKKWSSHIYNRNALRTCVSLPSRAGTSIRDLHIFTCYSVVVSLDTSRQFCKKRYHI